jgi:thiol-disulfide isomerase/thioredoxin
MKVKPETIVGGTVLLLAFLGLGILFVAPSSRMSGDAGDSKNAIPYIEIVDPVGFVNTEGITLGELVGKKVVLLDFVTYSCINCQRTFPYLNAWYEKYKDEGLEIVGIHTPEFAFEKDINNVRTAAKEFGLKFPLVLDNEYKTWQAYDNRYWPRKYLIDIHGNIVYDHIGEGSYEETETKIRELLAERATVLGGVNNPLDETLAVEEVPSYEITSQSPETYFGSLRNERLGNGTPSVTGEKLFTLPQAILPNTLYLAGSWNITPEYAESKKEASIKYRYTAQEVYLVMEADTPTEITIFQDGTEISTLQVKESKLYTLITNTASSEYTLVIRIPEEGVRLYALTFG